MDLKTLKDFEVNIHGLSSTEVFLKCYEMVYGYKPDPNDFLFDSIEEASQDLHDLIVMIERMIDD